MSTVESPHALRGPVLGPPPPRPAATGSRVVRLLLTGAAIVLVMAVATRQPTIALAISIGLSGAIVCAVRPAAAVVGAFFVSGAIGSLIAFTPLSPLQISRLADLILLGLWLGVTAAFLSGRGNRSPWLWPGVLAPALYLGLTGLQVFLTDPLSLGVDSFNAAAWYMLALVLIAIAPWSSETHVRIARGVVLIALAVGAYACFRLATGPTAAETAVAHGAQPGIQPWVTPRFFGSFMSANQLAAWAASLIPFCLALTLAWRGRWRLAPALAIPMLMIGLLASEIRTGVVAVVAGITLTLALFQFSRAFRGRSAAAAIAFLIVAVIGTGAFAVTIGGSGAKEARYSRLLAPGQDPAFEVRLQGWKVAVHDMSEHPWGHGLGTAGFVAQTENPYNVAGPVFLDNSYLKVGLEQGIVMMLLYVMALVILLLGLARRAMLIRDPWRASLAIGACGTLAALITLFLTGLYSEGMPIVAAWMLVGLGVAQVKVGPRRDPGWASMPSPPGA
ncbi:MAG: O-antigen ligase family protein [Actinomycetota bacterium]|nr:O-antigen ligase family protein [Actinomycetota bacterium]